jgi:SAM-dependent methyltransferase
MDTFIAANRLNWDDRARLHSSDTTGSYRIEEVLAGSDSLHAIEAGEIGDVAGKTLIHLQCHIGLDTISLAGRGAIATSLDFSPEAIAAARDFARRAGRDVSFVQADVYDAPAALGETYDVAFVSWGTVTWLPDIFRWAGVVGALLKPGGFLYFADTHPCAAALEQIDGRLVPHYQWRTPKDGPLSFDETSTYTGDARPLTHGRSYNWIHALSDIVSGLAEAGLTLEWLHEHERLPSRLFPMMVPAKERGMFRLPDRVPRFPLSFSLRAVKRT